MLIIGLGNIEPDYTLTRHNIGKDIVNSYTLKNYPEHNFNFERKFKVDFLKIESNYFIKPTLPMNVLGGSIYDFISFYKISGEDILIIYDDLDLVIGEYKVGNSFSKIHNGLKSVLKYKINNKDKITYIKTGVRGKELGASVQKSGRDPGKYVLSKFNKDEICTINKMLGDSLNNEITKFINKDNSNIAKEINA